ncbi:MAG TPA: PQQ-binding-like beta-propeller repeat protein [Actinomycetes bacterium]
MGDIEWISLNRRAALALLGVAGLAACGQAREPGAGRQVARTEGGSGSAERTTPQPGRGCEPPELPPRKAAVLAFDATGQQRWSVPLPIGKQMDANVGPLVEADTVYTTQGDELRALAAADGRQRWRLPLDGFVYDASLRAGMLVVRVGPLDRGRLLGVEAATGRVRWRYPSQPGPLSWQHASTADGGIAAIGDRGVLVVLDRRDGNLRWSRPSQARGLPKIFTTVGERVLRLDRGTLEAYQAGAGRLLWRTAGVHRGLDFGAQLTSRDDGILVWEGSSAATAVAAYRLDTGARRWRLGGLREPAVIGVGPAGIAVVSRIDRDQRHQLLLVDPASGQARWHQGLPGPLDLDMNPAVDRLALVTASEIVLVTRGPRGQAPIMLAAYRARDGRVAWRVPVQADQWPTWTPDGRLLIVGSPPDSTTPEQSLTAVDLHDGRLLWRSALPMIADRPAAPLGTGAVIQVWDPQRACATAGTASVGMGGRGGRSVGMP